MHYVYLCVTIFTEQRLLLCDDVLKEEKIDCVCVDDDLFQSSRPGDFDVTPTTGGGCSTYKCSTLPSQTDAKFTFVFR